MFPFRRDWRVPVPVAGCKCHDIGGVHGPYSL